MYTPRSCNPFAKIFYHPIDIALRWCNLMEYEAQILEAAYTCLNVLKTAFPQWPCLHANTEIIFDAAYNVELTYGCFGVSVPSGTQVDHTQLTITLSVPEAGKAIFQTILSSRPLAMRSEPVW